MRFKISRFPMGSSPAVGSSRTRILGLLAITPAIAALLFRRPKAQRGICRFTSSKSSPTRRIASSAAAKASSFVAPKFIGPKATSLRTVSSNSWYSGYWNSIPTHGAQALKVGLFGGEVYIVYLYASRGQLYKPLMCWTSVDLPLPVEPIMPTISPSFIVTDMP